MEKYWTKGEDHLRVEEEYQELLNEEEQADTSANTREETFSSVGTCN
jgi:hypothetical protein